MVEGRARIAPQLTTHEPLDAGISPTLQIAHFLQKGFAVWQGAGNFRFFALSHLMRVFESGEKLSRISYLVNAKVQMINSLVVDPQPRVVSGAVSAMRRKRKERLVGWQSLFEISGSGGRRLRLCLLYTSDAADERSSVD